MLTLARADAEHGDKALESLNLAAVVEEACELARPIAEDRHLDLSVTLNAAHLVNVRGDFITLRRLLWILLDNALKYTQAPGRIDVALSANSRQAIVEVRDSGVGISAVDLPHIFERFYRADPSRSNIDGAGLGLAIAKWIAEMHHADLTVASEMRKARSSNWFFRFVRIPVRLHKCATCSHRNLAGIDSEARHHLRVTTNSSLKLERSARTEAGTLRLKSRVLAAYSVTAFPAF